MHDHKPGLHAAVGIDPHHQCVVNETDPPPTPGPLWHAYAVLLTVTFGDRIGMEVVGGVKQVRNRMVEVTSIILDKDG